MRISYQGIWAAIIIMGPLGLNSAAVAQANVMKDCGCDKLTSGTLLTVRTEAKKEERAAFEKAFFCYASEETVKQAMDSSINIGIPIESVPVELKAGYSSSALRKFRASSCSKKDQGEQWKAITDSYEKYAPPELFASIDKCVQACKDQDGLYCDLNVLDTENLTFFARWRPTNELAAAKLTSLTVVGGQLVTTSNVGGSPTVKAGQSILPGGMSIPVRRNTPFSQVRTVLNTTQGACEATQAAFTVEYRAKATIIANGMVANPVQDAIKSTDHHTGGDCDGNQSGSESFCFADASIKAKSIGNFFEHSANCTRSVAPGAIGSPTPNCAVANWHIQGCGYKDYGIAKDCKGNGWLTYGGVLAGEKETPAAPVTFERTDTVRLGLNEAGSFSYQFPIDQIAAWRNPQLSIQVVISKILQGKEVGTISLNQQNLASGGASLSFNAQTGQASVQLKNSLN